MNTIHTTLLLLFLLLGSSTVAQKNSAQRFYVTDKRETARPTNTKIFINNQYGTIDFTGWNKDSVVINMSIWVEAPTQEMADEVLNQISIINQSSTGTISYKTVFTENFFSNYPFGIDYIIFAPHHLKLELHNRFGNISLHQFGSELIADIEYGNLIADKQFAPITSGRVSVMNGDLYMDEIQNIKVVHKNGELTIRQADRTSLLLDFSKGKIEKGNHLDLNLQTSYTQIKEAKEINSTLKTSTLIIDKLSGGKFFEASAKSSLEVKTLTPEQNEITFIGNNSNINVGLSKKISYHLHGELTNSQFEHYQTNNIKQIKESNKVSISGNFEIEGKTPASLIIFGENGNINILQTDKE